MNDQDICKSLAEAGYRQHGFDAFEGPPYWHPNIEDLSYKLNDITGREQISLNFGKTNARARYEDIMVTGNSLWQVLALLYIELSRI